MDEIARQRRQEERRQFGKRPKKIGDLLARVVASRGIGRFKQNDRLCEVWSEEVGKALAAATRPCGIRRGRFEVIAASSTVVQELSFDRRRLLEALQRRLPTAGIRQLSFRVGRLE